jgi:hypothetical protein
VLKKKVNLSPAGDFPSIEARRSPFFNLPEAGPSGFTPSINIPAATFPINSTTQGVETLSTV